MSEEIEVTIEVWRGQATEVMVAVTASYSKGTPDGREPGDPEELEIHSSLVSLATQYEEGDETVYKIGEPIELTDTEAEEAKKAIRAKAERGNQYNPL